MAKVTKYENYRVEVTPTQPGTYPGMAQIGGTDWEEGGERLACEEIERGIRRHVDGIRDARGNPQVRVICDANNTCEFCGYNWGEESESYNGGCCEEDRKNKP